MGIVSPPRPRAKPTQPVRSSYHACHRGAGTLEIQRGERLESYTCRETTTPDLPEFGGVRSFRLVKDSDGKAYDCLIAADFAESTCDCADWTYAEDRPYACKHLIAIQSALETGGIDGEDAEYPASEPSCPDETDAPAGAAQEATPPPAGGDPGDGDEGDGDEGDGDEGDDWRLEDGTTDIGGPFFWVWDGDREIVATLSDGGKRRTSAAVAADAHLIAASRKLLGVARLALRVCDPAFIAKNPEAAELRAKAEIAFKAAKGGAR